MPIDFFLRDKGKLIEKFKKVRAKQSKISLKFTTDLRDTKDIYGGATRRNITINPLVLARLEKEYKYRSDPKEMRKHHYNVRDESPFNSKNRPPIEYLMDIGKMGKVAAKIS
jgi:hypothetical protein